jgi:uncharacterized membrane protein
VSSDAYILINGKEENTMAEEKEVKVPVEEITNEDKMMGLLSYIIQIIVPLIILLTETMKVRKFQRYHAIQSLGLSAVSIIYSILACIVYSVLSALTGGLGACCLWILFLLPLIPAVYYGILAYQGQYCEIPVLTDFMVNQGWLERP